MRNLVETLKEMTERMVEQIDEVTEEQILFFIEQREQIVHSIQQTPITEAEIQQFGSTIRAILKSDPIIIGKLEELRTEAGQGLQKVGVARIQNHAYGNPYSADSYYFDKKK